MPKLFHRKPQPSRKAAGPPQARGHLESVLQRVASLADAGENDEALALLERNRGRLGQFAPFCAALASLYGEAGRHLEAAEQARLALDLAPRHPDYHLLAAVSYFAASYFSFAQRARREWLRLAPGGPLLAQMKMLDEEYRRGAVALRDNYHLRSSEVAEEAGLRLDEGRWAMAHERWAEALKYAQTAAHLAPGWPPPRNNTATALYYLGRHAEAIAELKGVLRDCDPDNLHALANLTRFHVTIGDLPAAGQYADRLIALPLPTSLDDVIKTIEGLAALDRDADIDRILRFAAKKLGSLTADLYIHWAIAAANAGQRKLALTRLRQAEKMGASAPLFGLVADAIRRKLPGPGIASRFPQTHFAEWVGKTTLEEAIQIITREGKTGRRDERAWADLLRRNPALPMAARRMLYETAPESILPMVQLLAGLRTPEALQTLTDFVSGTVGADADRLQALQVMQQNGLVKPGQPIAMWVDGEKRQIEARLQTISDDRRPDYPQAAWEQYERGVIAHREGRTADAERHYETMLKIEPRAKEAYNNLAVLYQQQGDEARKEACLDKALEIDPLYIFPRTARALQALSKEGVEAAREWLKPLVEVEHWHPLAFAAYQKALAQVEIAAENYKRAEEHLKLALKLSEEDAEAKKLLDHVTVMATTGGFADWWRKMADTYRQRRQRAPLPADPTLADCFGLLTKGDMTGIWHIWHFWGVSALKRAALQEQMMARLLDPDFVARLVNSLNASERMALRDLLEHGGVMGWQAFARLHGDDLTESPYLEYHAKELKTVMGRLRARGLLFEGTADGKLIVATPRDLRPLLQEALAKAG